MIGGFCEYIGMATGNSALMLLVFGAYGASAFCQFKKGARQPQGLNTAIPPIAG